MNFIMACLNSDTDFSYKAFLSSKQESHLVDIVTRPLKSTTKVGIASTFFRAEEELNSNCFLISSNS